MTASYVPCPRKNRNHLYHHPSPMFTAFTTTPSPPATQQYRKAQQTEPKVPEGHSFEGTNSPCPWNPVWSLEMLLHSACTLTCSTNTSRGLTAIPSLWHSSYSILLSFYLVKAYSGQIHASTFYTSALSTPTTTPCDSCYNPPFTDEEPGSEHSSHFS